MAPPERRGRAEADFATLEEDDVTAHLTVVEVLAQLEAQMALHQEQAAHHAAQEVLHREQKEAHTAEYETVARHYEAFKATAGAALELAARTAAPPPPSPLKDLPPGRPVLRSRLVARVVAELPADQVFNASGLAAEVNRRYGPALRKPADARLASAALRRLLAKGVIRLAQKGAARREALYTRA